MTASCTGKPDAKTAISGAPEVVGSIYVAHDTAIAAAFIAAGVAEPIRQATLSTKLMGTVTAVLVREGDHVVAGQVVARIDARDLTAKSAQAAASMSDAEIVHRDATTQANRIRALYTDSAATRAQLDAVETGLARANAAVGVAHAAEDEVSVMRSYSVISSPFSGVVTKRFVDPGAFAAPGAPLVTVQDASQLRITTSVTPDIASGLMRGQMLTATIEGLDARATIEGVVPAVAGNLYVINALVPNADTKMLAGSAATLAVPTRARHSMVVPTAAIIREGDLTGVTLRGRSGDERRWVRVGRTSGDMIEVLAGLRAGDRVVIPTSRVALTGGK
ncbi:MAG: efflux RND transporter periplasmic adaptor subunit [bacterium]